MPFRQLDITQPQLTFPLAALAAADRIVVRCQPCNRRSAIFPAELLARVSPAEEVEAVLERVLRCGACGGRGSWRSGGALAWFVERAEPP